MKTVRTLVAATAALAFWAGAGVAQDSITIAMQLEPPNLDPFHQAGDARTAVTVLMYQGLMYEHPSGAARPQTSSARSGAQPKGKAASALAGCRDTRTKSCRGLARSHTRTAERG